MSDFLLQYLALMFIPPQPFMSVRETLERWSWYRSSMTEPEGWRKLPFKFVLWRIETKIAELETLRDLGVEFIAGALVEPGDVAMAFDTVDFEVVKHDVP